jgi:hypothetical protein
LWCGVCTLPSIAERVCVGFSAAHLLGLRVLQQRRELLEVR